MTLYAFETITFFLVYSYDQFANAPMRNVSLPAKVIEKAVSFCAEGSLEKTVRVIDACVYYLAVATARLLSEAVVLFDEQYAVVPRG